MGNWLNGQISQGAHGAARRSAVAAIDDGGSGNINGIFDSYGEAAAIGTNNLKLDVVIH
jgi:hypothetical protein